MNDEELPGMWEAADFTGGADEVRPPSRELIRAADAAQYAREAIPAEQRGQIRVRLLNATPDPLGSVAALGKQYKGEVVRSLSEVTDEERRSYLDDFGKTVLNGPLESAQFHWQIEGVTRSITHQMVRSRASFFAQESLRFAVPEGDWAEEIPLPPSLAGLPAKIDWERRKQDPLGEWYPFTDGERLLRDWKQSMRSSQMAYEALIAGGMPAEEARGVLPHDMPTRIHWVMDLRTLLAESGKRTCTQAQFPWRLIFAGMANELRNFGTRYGIRQDAWQYREIADRLRPVCFQTGKCGFMAAFDRSCSIRDRVDANAEIRRDPKNWGADYLPFEGSGQEFIPAIHDYEWAANPSAARS